MLRRSQNLFSAAALAVVLEGCATPAEFGTNRPQLLAGLEHEMVSNTSWVRIHAAESLLDNGETGKVAASFHPEAETATAPYRIGVWRVLARATTNDERNQYIERIRAVMHDAAATDRLSAAETLGKLHVANRSDREFILNWLAIDNDAAAPFLRWLLVLSSNASEHEGDEAALAQLLKSPDAVARLRAAYALGRLKELSPSSLSLLKMQLASEPPNSVARVYFITALLFHETDTDAVASLRKALIPYLNGRPNEQLEAATAIGLTDETEARALLHPLLGSPEPDARIGAANGLLRLIK